MQSETFETPAQRRLDTTTSMAARDSDLLPAQPSFTGTPHASDGRAFDADSSIRSQMATVPILVLLQQCICAVGGPCTTPTDPANKVALDLLVDFLSPAQTEQPVPDECIAFVPASRYAALRTAAQRTLDSIRRTSAPTPPAPARRTVSPGPSHPKNPLPKDWAFDGTHCARRCPLWQRRRPYSVLAGTAH